MFNVTFNHVRLSVVTLLGVSSPSVPCQARFNPRGVSSKTGAAFRRKVENCKILLTLPFQPWIWYRVVPFYRIRRDLETVVKGWLYNRSYSLSLTLHTFRAFQP
jgi:hypothetical protein